MEELNKKLTQHEKTARSQQQRVKVSGEQRPGAELCAGQSGGSGGSLSPGPRCLQALEGELQSEATRQQERVAELQEQLAQKEQAAEHYKGQVWSHPHPSPSIPIPVHAKADGFPSSPS